MEIIQFIQTECIYLTWISDLFTFWSWVDSVGDFCWEYSSSDWWLNWQNEIWLVNRICTSCPLPGCAWSLISTKKQFDQGRFDMVWCSKARTQKWQKTMCTFDFLVWITLMILDNDTNVWIQMHLFDFLCLQEKGPHTHKQHTHTHTKKHTIKIGSTHTHTHQKKNHQDIKIIDSSSCLRCWCFCVPLKAQQATGYPLAYVAAKLALGHDLVQLRLGDRVKETQNDNQQKTTSRRRFKKVRFLFG